MAYYTAKELAEVLQSEGDEEMTLRKVRYYTQIGMLSELEMDENKSKYSAKHLEELRAIRVMQKTGEKLEDIKEKIRGLNMQRLSDLNTHAIYLSADKLLRTTTYTVNKDITLTFSDQVETATKQMVINAVENSLGNMGD